jgi:hypothetical protein
VARWASWRFGRTGEPSRTWLGVSVGEAAFAGSAFTAALTTVDTVMSGLHPFAPAQRWGTQILVGFWPRLMTGSILLFVRFAGERTFVSIVQLLMSPLFWMVVPPLLLGLAYFFPPRGAIRAALHVTIAMLTVLVTVVVTLYAGALHPAATLISQWGLVALVAACAWASSLRRALRRVGAPVLVICQSAFIAATVAASARRGARLTLEDRRFIPDPAYDVVIAGDPPSLAFTNQEQLRLIRAPYGPPGATSEEMLDGVQTERLFPADDVKSFYLATSAHGVRRVSLGDEPQIVSFVTDNSRWSVALAEDPPRRRLFVLNEWDGTGSIFPLDAPGQARPIRISDCQWPIPWITADPASRRAYVTSPVADGRLRILDLETLEFVNERPGFFLYKSAIDPERRLLWATRPVPGELMGIDTATLEVRARIPLAWGTRSVAFDPARNQIFVNTYPYGVLFRVDGTTGRVLEVGGCGFRCRSLYMDLSHRTLWAASLEGIYRFPLDQPIGKLIVDGAAPGRE